MIVVADASVLIGLSSIGYLHLIQEQFSGKVLIPPAVWKEVVEQGGDRPGSHQVSKADWINVHDLKNQDISTILKMELDEGESEAIALADELKADVVLLDEKDARRIAKQLGLRVLGTIGILVWGKRVGKINNLRQVLDILQNRAMFRISHTLYQQALKSVGEFNKE